MCKQCMLCFNEAAYKSNNSDMYLCEDCYTSMSDEFECSMENELGCCFDEYYDISEIDD